MHYSVKLLIPVGLAAAAAALNFMTLQSSLQTVDFIAAKKSIKSGQLITESDLTQLSLPAEFRESLSRTAPLFNDSKGGLSGQRAARDIPEGDIIMYRDTAIDDVRGAAAGAQTSLTVPLGRNTEYAGLFQPGMRVYFRISEPAQSNSELLRYKRLGPFVLNSVESGKITGMRNDSEEQTIDRVSIAFNPDAATQSPIESELQQFLDRLSSGQVDHPRVYPAAR